MKNLKRKVLALLLICTLVFSATTVFAAAPDPIAVQTLAQQIVAQQVAAIQATGQVITADQLAVIQQNALIVATQQLSDPQAAALQAQQAAALQAQQAATIQAQQAAAIRAQQAAAVKAQQAAAQNVGNDVTVYIAASGEGNRYHRSGCRTLKNGQVAINLSQAKAMGRTACGICY